MIWESEGDNVGCQSFYQLSQVRIIKLGGGGGEETSLSLSLCERSHLASLQQGALLCK